MATLDAHAGPALQEWRAFWEDVRGANGGDPKMVMLAINHLGEGHAGFCDDVRRRIGRLERFVYMVMGGLCVLVPGLEIGLYVLHLVRG